MLKDIEKRIIDCLSNLNIAIHVYHSFSTESTYIKLDYGALNSIRISNHDGKAKYNYKYNIGTNIEEYEEVDCGNFVKCYYPASDIDRLLCDVLIEHANKIKDPQYTKIKETRKANRDMTLSFWRCCIEIKA